MNQHYQFYATCPRGLESLLAQELVSVDAQNVSATDGGVSFSGDFSHCYRANLKAAWPPAFCGRSVAANMRMKKIFTKPRTNWLGHNGLTLSRIYGQGHGRQMSAEKP